MKPVVKNLVVVESVDSAAGMSAVAVDSRPVATLAGGEVTANLLDPLALNGADFCSTMTKAQRSLTDGCVRPNTMRGYVFIVIRDNVYLRQ